MTDLSGKVAVVTGGSRGIGRAIAEALAGAGASLAINGRSEQKGQQAIAEMKAAHGDKTPIFFQSSDVTRQADVEGFIDAVIEHYGRIDILVNNAGGSSGYAPIDQLSDEAWHEANNWILNSAFWATRKTLPDMLSRNWGRIINISSVEGRQANKATVSHYITFKHALNGFTKACAFEYGEQGITCNAISPGGVETDMMLEQGPKAAETMGITYEELKATYAADSALKRMVTVDEIAALALLIVSEQGSGFTGANFALDGGSAL
ncbi:MAG: SDR family NAD(P)-dependent oxidoreductase [Pseudomonadota bacterium]